jgi:hypothetical protein
MNETAVRLLVVTKGHPFDASAFSDLLGALPGVRATQVEHPAAQSLLAPGAIADYDAVLFYDMLGIGGIGMGGTFGEFFDPPDAYRRGIEGLLELGIGFVLLNHATTQWPTWPLWREISGSSFMLRAGPLWGELAPGSGYRGGMGQPDRYTETHLRPVATDHPALAGLENGFEICDELYLKTSRFESRVLPLLESDYAFEADNFSPPPLASADEQASWSHPAGSAVVAWANAARNSPVISTDLGDGPQAYRNPAFRRFVANAVHWVASPDARRWAKARRD